MEKKERNLSIDRFRGLIIFVMIFFQLLEHFKNLGVFATICTHAPDSFVKTAETISKGFKGIFILPNFTLADMIAPGFLFAIALTFIPSYKRRVEKYGKKKAIDLLLERYLILIGIGIMMSSINVVLDGDLLNGFFDIIDIPIFGVTVLVLLLGLIWLFLKKKEIGKKIGNVIRVIVIILGLIGICITLVNTILVTNGISEQNFGYWLVLQHIGLAGIFATIVMSFSENNSSLYRLTVGIVTLILFTIFHETTLPTLSNYTKVLNNMNIIDNTADGGFIGGIAYGALLLIFTAITDVYYNNKKKYNIISLLLFVPALLVILYAASTFKAWDGSSKLLTAGLSEHLSINKGSISPSYLIISLFICSFAFMIIDLFRDKKLKFDFLDIWGRNPILMYILEFALIGGVMAAIGGFAETASVPVAIIIVLLLTGILTFIAYRLYKKDKYIKI